MCFVVVGQIIIPINKTREESYGVWKYNTLTIDSIFTILDGTFVASDSCSIWATYSEKLRIDSTYYECLFESLPIEPYDSVFYPGDTLRYREVFMPIMRELNSYKQLEFIGSDSIDFVVSLPKFNRGIDLQTLSQSFINNTTNLLTERKFIPASRKLKISTKCGAPFDTLIVWSHISNILSATQYDKDISLSEKKIISKDLYTTALACVNGDYRKAEKFLSYYLSILNQSDLSDITMSIDISTIVIDSLSNDAVLSDTILAKVLNCRAISNMNLNKFQKASDDLQRGDSIVSSFPHSRLWVLINTNLSSCYQWLSNYEESLKVNLRMLNKSSFLTPKDLLYLYLRLCYDYHNLNSSEQAIFYALKALSDEATTDEIKYDLYYTLGQIYSDEKHNMKEAEKFYDKWAKLSLNISQIPDNFIDYINKRELLTTFYINIRNYPKAISNEYYNLMEIKEMMGTKCWEYAMSLNNMANALRANGERKKSIMLSQASFDLRKDLHETDSIAVPLSSLVRSSINLSDFYREDGYYEKAREYANYSLCRTDSTDDLRIQALLKSAYIDFELNNNEEGFDKIIEATHTVTLLKRLNPDKQYYNEELNLLSVMMSFGFDYGAYKDVLKYLQDYYSIIKTYNLPNKYILDYQIQALRCYAMLGKNKHVIKTGRIILSIIKEMINDAFIRLDNIQRSNFMNELSILMNNVCAYVAWTNNSSAGELLYNLTLLRKGVLLQAEIDFDRFVLSTDDEKLISLLNELKKNNQLIDNGNLTSSLDSIQNVTEKIEHDLIRLSQPYGDFTNNLFVTWKDIKNNLSASEVAIEFIKTTIHNELDSIIDQYYAILVSPNLSKPQIIEIDLSNTDLTDIENYDRDALYKNIWLKLYPYLLKTRTIYISYDGILHNLEVEHLTDMFGNCIGDKFEIYRLSSTRQLLRQLNGVKINSLCMYGGLDYNNSDTSETIDEFKKTYNTYPNQGLRELRDLRYGVTYLPYTLKEISEIEAIFREYNYNNLLIFKGIHGTENSLKKLGTDSISVVHFATHGFYWDKDVATKRNYIGFLSSYESNDELDDALIRSGLFMSGANKALKGSGEQLTNEDGILTAKEISLLNLNNVDMVVLSACQTGLGDTFEEGVFGLQRGFKLAGVNSLLMSLWKVDDEATQILMTEFYRNLLKGYSKYESLKIAQEILRSSQHFSSPEYWAAFILLDALN